MSACLHRKSFLGMEFGRFCDQDSLHAYATPTQPATVHTHNLRYRDMLSPERYRRARRSAIVGGLLGVMLGVTMMLAIRALTGNL